MWIDLTNVNIFEEPRRQNLSSYPKYVYDRKQEDNDHSIDDSQVDEPKEKKSPTITRAKSSFAVYNQKSNFANSENKDEFKQEKDQSEENNSTGQEVNKDKSKSSSKFKQETAKSACCVIL